MAFPYPKLWKHCRQIFYDLTLFLAFIIAIGFQYSYLNKFKPLKLLLIPILIFNVICLIQMRHHYFKQLQKQHQPIKTLKQKYGKRLKNNFLFIFNIPKEFIHNGYLTQALEIYGINKAIQNILYTSLDIQPIQTNISNFLLIKHNKNTIRLTSSNIHKLWFTKSNQLYNSGHHWEKTTKMIIYKQLKEKIFDVTIEFDTQIIKIKPNLKFVTWDYRNSKFYLLN